MSLVNFTNLDFDQIKQSIKNYLRSNSNFTDYDFEGSNLSNIIDILAYNTYISSYNANMISNEVFIDSATLRENVVSLARNIGYVPRSASASKTSISFFVDTSNYDISPLTVTLKKGIVCTTSLTVGSINYTFAIPDDVTATVVNGAALFNNVTIYEGSYVTNNFTVSSLNLNQRFILDNPNIDTSTIRVIVKDTQNSTITKKFTLANSLIGVDSSSKVFYIQEIEDQRYELIFGDGVFGEKLQDQNFIEVSYVTTNASSANGISGFSYAGRLLDNNETPITNGISLITSDGPTQDGNEIEPVSSIKKYSNKFYSSQNRAVTSGDYEAIIYSIYPEAESISVFGGEDLSPPQYGKVFITIKPYNNEILSLSIKNNLRNKLKKYTVAGIVPEILDLKYLFVEYDSTVYYNDNLASSSDSVRTVIYNNILKYADSTELNKYGSRFKYSKFLKIIDDSSDAVTSNITKIKIRRDLRPEIGSPAEYEICFGNAFHVRSDQGFNIKSSGFFVNGISGEIYLSDIPNPNSIDLGEIIFFRTNSQNQASVVKRSVGKINYAKGEILLNPVIFTSTAKTNGGVPVIEISATPKSNDVVGLQDLYLQLDTSNGVLNMLSDTISSGADVSGTSFTSTSSYSNGILVRP